ncbi:MAG: hypothetical protein V7754_21855 [Halioglobus sp.]
MKIIRLLLVVFMLAPFASFAETTSPNKTEYIFNSGNWEFYPDVLVDCAWAIPFMPTELINGWSTSLSALQVHKGNGKVLKNGALVGEMWVCIGDGMEGLDPYGETFQQPIMFVIINGDQVLGAVGTLQILMGDQGASDPFIMVGVRAQVWRVVDGAAEGDVAGILTASWMVNNSDFTDGTNATVNIHFFAPLPNF